MSSFTASRCVDVRPGSRPIVELSMNPGDARPLAGVDARPPAGQSRIPTIIGPTKRTFVLLERRLTAVARSVNGARSGRFIRLGIKSGAAGQTMGPMAAGERWQASRQGLAKASVAGRTARYGSKSRRKKSR